MFHPAFKIVFYKAYPKNQIRKGFYLGKIPPTCEKHPVYFALIAMSKFIIMSSKKCL